MIKTLSPAGALSVTSTGDSLAYAVSSVQVRIFFYLFFYQMGLLEDLPAHIHGIFFSPLPPGAAPRRVATACTQPARSLSTSVAASGLLLHSGLRCVRTESEMTDGWM